MKAKTILGSLFILLASCQTSAQGWFGQETIKESKNYVTKEINVEDFTRINLVGSPTVTYTQQAGKPTVTIYTSDNIAEALDIHVKDATLYVGFKKNLRVSYKKLDIRVSSPRLEGVNIAGSGEVHLPDGLDTGDLQLSVAGSGDLSLKGLLCQSVGASVAGSGDLVLNGTADQANYHVSGSGDLSASKLKAQQVEASVAGSGDITCHATDLLKANISGSGEIGYAGSPRLEVPKKGIYKL